MRVSPIPCTVVIDPLMKATKPAPSVEEQVAAVWQHSAPTPVKYARAPDANGAVATGSRPPATQDHSR